MDQRLRADGPQGEDSRPRRAPESRTRFLREGLGAGADAIHEAERIFANENRTAGGTPVVVENMDAWYGRNLAIRGVSMTVKPRMVTALIGPSGCGKSTLLRTLDRLHELVPGARAEGRVIIDGQNIYDHDIDPTSVRRLVGMVFQRPNPFPTMSIFDNVVAGLKLVGGLNKHQAGERVERSLRQAALWDEVKDRLRTPAVALSGGQQQRLCIARALAVEPAVILMDEPASALDPISTQRIEDTITELKRTYTVIIVTHNMQQAARVSDFTAFMLAGQDRTGELIEYGQTRQIFTNPKDPRTEDYITGRFG